MKRRFSEEQIIGILRKQEAGGTVKKITRRHGVSEQSFYRWKAKYADLEVSELRRLKELEAENAKLLGFAENKGADNEKPGTSGDPGSTKWLVAGAGFVQDPTMLELKKAV
jgi:putative transposase